MGMMSELEVTNKPHESDDLRFQRAHDSRHAAGFSAAPNQKIQGKESIHFTASLETVGTICKLIEPEKQTIERILERIIEILVSQIG